MDGHQPLRSVGGEPLRAVRRQGPARYEIMDMRMVGHLSEDVEPTVLEGGPAGILHTVSGHGLGSGGHTDATTAWSRKNPGGMAVGCPVLSEQGEGAGGQGDLAVLGACAATHMDEHAGAVVEVATETHQC